MINSIEEHDRASRVLMRRKADGTIDEEMACGMPRHVARGLARVR